MSTPLVVLACILALFAVVLIALMMTKGDRQQHKGRQHSQVKKGKGAHKKRNT